MTSAVNAHPARDLLAIDLPHLTASLLPRSAVTLEEEEGSTRDGTWHLRIVQGTTNEEGNAMRFYAFLAAASVACLASGSSWAQDVAAGEKIFAKCKACHVPDKDQNRVGPGLKGLFGRTAGTHAGFKYSPAMVEAGKGGLVWDEATFKDYIHDPKAKVKGTKMAFAGLKDDTEIANLIAYLKQFP